MSKCIYCNVKIKDVTDHCPLCGSVLENANSDDCVNTYPNVLKKEKALSFIFRLMLFIGLVSVVTCIGINITTGMRTLWSLIVAFVFLYTLIILYMFVREDAGYRVRTFWICTSGIILVTATDYILGFRRWSVNYVFPGVIAMLDLAFVILMIVNHRNWQSYILIMFLLLIVSVIPIILYQLDVITNPYPTQIAFAFSAVLTAGILIFGGPRVRSELHRRFHIMGK